MPTKSTVLINAPDPDDFESTQAAAAEAAKPAPAPPPPPAKEKKATKAQLDGVAAFLADDFPHHKFVAPDDEKPEGGQATEKEGAEEAAAPAKPEPKPKRPAARPKPRVEPAPALTGEQIAEAAARGVVKGMAETKEVKTRQPFGDHDMIEIGGVPAKLQVLRHMESLEPDKYKGIADKYIKNLKAIDDYAKKWETDNPGQEFDEDSPEHANFLKDKVEDWPEEEFDRAKVDLYTAPILDKAAAAANKRIEELERKVKVQESARDIATQQITAAKLFWPKLGDEFKDMILPNGQVNESKYAELGQKNHYVQAIVDTAKHVNAESEETYKLFSQLVSPDYNNPVHVEISSFALAKEEEMMKLPIEERTTPDGKVFVTAKQLDDMPLSERRNHWTLNADDVVRGLANYHGKKLKDWINVQEANHRAWNKLHGIPVPDPGQAAATPEQGSERELTPMEEAEMNRRNKPHGPSFMADTRGGATRGALPPGSRQVGPLDVSQVI